MATVACVHSGATSTQSRPVRQMHLDIDDKLNDSPFKATQNSYAVSFADIGAGLANSFEQDTLVHTRVLTDSGYQTKLKAIKDIQVGDEVLAWDELQAHDNAAMAQAGQAAQTLQAVYQQARLGIKSASSPINTVASSYENNSIKGIKSAQRYEKVTDTVSSFKEQTLLHITLSNGQTIQATAGHPFKTLEGWRDAVLLKKGGQLLLGGEADKEDRYATILEIREEVKTTAVYNLEVANLHTFFVGVDGVVVHNGASPPNLSPPGAGRNGAFREAKRYLDIAMNAPCKIKPARDKKNNLTGKKEYDFGDGKVIRQDPPHNYGPGNSQNRGNHFNTPDNAHFDF